MCLYRQAGADPKSASDGSLDTAAWAQMVKAQGEDGGRRNASGYWWVSSPNAAEFCYPETSVKLTYAIAGEGDPSHSVPDQNPADREV